MSEDMDCPHVGEAAAKLKLDVEQIKAALNKRSCNVCLRVDQLWMCIECRQILCGHNAVGHSTAHYEFHKTHCIFINLESAGVFCFKCSSEVDPKNHDDELNRLRQFILYNRGPSAINNNINKRRRGKAPKAVKPKKASFKRGPRANKKVCIPNNENDCYMNTVTPALSEPEPQAVIPNTLNDNSEKALIAVVPNTLNDNSEKALIAVVPNTLNDNNEEKALLAVEPTKVTKPKKIVFKRGPRTYKKVGISNRGNHCYMNSIWQSLRHLKPFIHCLKLFNLVDECNQQDTNNNSDPRFQNSIAEELWKLLITLVEWQKPAGFKCREAISPSALLSIVCKIKPRYKGYRQQDAHEFLMFTLDTLHSELTDEKSKLLEEEGIVVPKKSIDTMDTLVSLMFRGFLISEVCCLNCMKLFRTKDPTVDISLEIPDRKDHDQKTPLPVDLLTGCLEKYFEVEKLNEKNYYFCDVCRGPKKSTKRFWMHSLPNVLSIHLKRFRWDETKLAHDKIHTHITFPMKSLNMYKYIDHVMKKDFVDEFTHTFDLVAVVVHNGEGVRCGHYTSYAVDDDGKWYEYNDEKVHEVDANLVQNLQAYMLFYVKKEMIRFNLN